MLSLDLHSSHSPTIVLAALRSHGGEWRAPQIPRELRDTGICAVECRVKQRTCTLKYRRRWYGAGAPGQWLRARATVEPAVGGARVALSVGHALPDLRIQALALLLCIPSYIALFGRTTPWLLLGLVGLFAVVIGLQYWWMRTANRSISRSELEVDYLLRRIEETVAGAGTGRAMRSLTDPRQTWPRATPIA